MLKSLKNNDLKTVLFAIVALSFVALLGLWIQAYLLTFAATLLSIFLLLPDRIIFLSRVLLSYSVFFIYTLTFAFLVQVTGFKLFVGVLLLTLQIGLILYALTVSRKRALKLPLFGVGDIIIIFVCILSFLAIVRPLVNQPLPVVVKSLASGEDNASHYALYNSILETGESSYFHKASELGIVPNLVGYPQGLHINMAMNTQILENTTEPSSEIKLLDFAYQTALYYVFFIGAFGALALELVKRYRSKSTIIVATILAPTAWNYYIFGNGFILYNYGFQTQIVAYAMLALTLIATIYFNNLASWRNVAMLGALAVGLSNTWFFLLPVLLIYMLLWRGKSLPTLFKSGKTLLVVIISAAISAIPLVAGKASDGNAGSINLGGAVYPLTANNLYVCAIILTAALLVPVYKQKREFSSFVKLTVSCLIFSGLIGLYQLSTVGEVKYYYYKSLYIFPVLAAVALFFALVHLIDNLSAGKTWRTRLVILLPVLVFFASLTLFTGMPKYSRLYLYENYMLISDVDKQIIGQALKTPRGHDVLTYKFCSPGVGYINQRWTGSLLLTEDKQRFSFYSNSLLKQESPEDILSYSKKKPSTVLYNPKCTPEADVIKMQSEPNIIIKPINL